MQAGKLNKRIQIQEASESRDAGGGVISTWSTIDTVWGAIEPLSGIELVEAQQVHARATIKVRIRTYPGLTTHHRLIYTESA